MSTGSEGSDFKKPFHTAVIPPPEEPIDNPISNAATRTTNKNPVTLMNRLMIIDSFVFTSNPQILQDAPAWPVSPMHPQVGVKGGGNFSGNDWTLGGVGNYWSDFAGFDADGDGIGDVPYRLADLYSTITDDHPELAFFSETPAARALSVIARIFPVLEPRPKVEDLAPLINQPALPVSTAESHTTSGALTVASLLMLAVAGSMAALGGTRTRRHGRRIATT